ncbi:MAG: serine/threonine-protein phosphatase, partial [Myxococcales bacterium]
MSFNIGSRTSPVLVTVASLSDVGQQRQQNQDALLCQPLPPDGSPGQGALVVAVCDGMGGGEGGEVASALATTALGRGLQAGPLPESEAALGGHLVATVEGAHALVRATARQERLRDMGTTATVALLRGDRVLVGQVGDSRAYLLRGGELRQLTRDQSLAQQMIEAGQLRPEDRSTFEYSNIILQALGTTSSALDVDLTATSVRRGDRLLLCSDGLWGELDEAEIAAVLAGASDPDEACRRLIDAANAAGGSDNITCVVCQLDGDGLPPPSPGEPLPSYQKLL